MLSFNSGLTACYSKIQKANRKKKLSKTVSNDKQTEYSIYICISNSYGGNNEEIGVYHLIDSTGTDGYLILLFKNQKKSFDYFNIISL